MDLYLCPPKVDLRGLSVTQVVISLQKQYNECYCSGDGCCAVAVRTYVLVLYIEFLRTYDGLRD
jgi:hypothetical protein